MGKNPAAPKTSGPATKKKKKTTGGPSGGNNERSEGDHPLPEGRRENRTEENLLEGGSTMQKMGSARA